MPNMCVAYGCSKSPKDNVTVFKFPKDLVCFRKWEQQVQQTRANWHAKPSSDLCSDHFELDCFEVKPFFMLQLGVSLKCPLRLKKGAIPSIFVPPPSVTPGCGQTAGNSKRSTKDDEPTTSCTPKRKRGGVAFEKREHAGDAGCQTTKPHGPSRISKRTQTRFCGKDKVRTDQPHSKEVSEMEAAHISPELPIRWVVSADRTVEIKEEVTELGCDQANERILQEETPPSSITEREH
ncbi:THAP domain-containing protein 10-like [Acipenser ruthenus]|uniref:THAP domain-containing protein 10-like n=1 Tax=Acipenser ruthenus TaxID=7906 RepID=UPI002740782E|nr:THAP domain-containing protein 10-like [Acipenser ruthenus]